MTPRAAVRGIFDEVRPARVVLRQRRPVVVVHGHRHVHDAFGDPRVPVRVHVVVRPRVFERAAGGARRRRVPGDARHGELHLRLYILDVRVNLADEAGNLVAPPLLELLGGGQRLSAESEPRVVSRDACGVVALVAAGEPDVVEVQAVNIEVCDEVHAHVGEVLLALRVTRIEGLVAGLFSAIVQRHPVAVGIVRVAVLPVDAAGRGRNPGGRSRERHDPRMHGNALLAARCVVRGVDDRLQGVEGGRRQTRREIRLAHARRVADIRPAAHLHEHGVAVCVADGPFGARARHPEKRVHLRLVQEAVVPRVHPPAPQLVRGRWTRADKQPGRKKRSRQNAAARPQQKGFVLQDVVRHCQVSAEASQHILSGAAPQLTRAPPVARRRNGKPVRNARSPDATDLSPEEMALCRLPHP